MQKQLNETFIFNIRGNHYKEVMYNVVMKYPRIDVGHDKKFEDLRYELKRHNLDAQLLHYVLESGLVVFVMAPDVIPYALTTFMAKDLDSKEKKRKIFIVLDSNSLKVNQNGVPIPNIPRLMSYIYQVKNLLTYYNKTNPEYNVLRLGALSYSKLFAYVIDYLTKINTVNGGEYRIMCKYYAAKFFCETMYGVGEKTTLYTQCAEGCPESKARVFEIKADSKSFNNIKTFIEFLAKVFNTPKLTLTGFVETWLYLFGTSTAFGIDYAPSLLDMLTDTYVGAFINNQNTIEKILGNDIANIPSTLISH